MRTLFLYQRDGCHLCEQMLSELEAASDRLGFQLQTRDVDSNPRWRESYGEKVPVLTLDDDEVCHYFLDVEALEHALQTERSGQSRKP